MGRLAVVLVIALAAVLRLYHLGTESLWIDEGYSLRDASNIGSMTAVRPLYFYMLHFWMKFGHSEAWLRLPSVIFGIGSAALLYAAARRIYGHKVGLIASLLLAISPLHINHSQEVRMYSLTTFLVIAEVIFFMRYVDTGRARYIAGCLALSAAAFLVFPLTVLMLAVFNLFSLGLLRQRRVTSLKWYASQFVIGLAAIPLSPQFIRVIQEYGEAWTWRIPRPGVLDLIWATRDFNLWRIPVDNHGGILIGGAYAVFVLALAAYGAVSVYKGARWQTSLVVLWLAVPMVIMAVVSNTLANLWLVRYMIYASPAFYILTALGLASIQKRWVFGLMVAVVMFLPVVRIGTYYGRIHRPEWRQAVAYVEGHLQKGDTIAVYRYGNRYVFDYYYSGRAPWVALGPTHLSKSMFGNWSDRRIADMMSAIPLGSKRIWFALSYHEDTGGFSIENYINNRYHVLETRDFVRVKLYLVTRR